MNTAPKLTSVALCAALIAALAAPARGDDPPKGPVDRFVDSAAWIFVGRCVGVGALKENGESDASFEVLLPVKGALRKGEKVEIAVWMSLAVSRDEVFLLRTGQRASVDSPAAIVPVPDYVKVSELESLTPVALVTRVLGWQASWLDEQIRRLDMDRAAIRDVLEGRRDESRGDEPYPYDGRLGAGDKFRATVELTQGSGWRLVPAPYSVYESGAGPLSVAVEWIGLDAFPALAAEKPGARRRFVFVVDSSSPGIAERRDPPAVRRFVSYTCRVVGVE